MSPDRYAEGYRAAVRHHENARAQRAKVTAEWTRPEAEKVRSLIRKHWPALADALDLMGDAQ